MVSNNSICGGRALRIAVGITALVLLMAGGVGATKSINDGATGGDCTSIGTWNVSSKTCTLTTDLTETIEIDSDGITLDGSGHMITGSGNTSGNGLYLSGRNGVTIKNTNVRNFFYGIYLNYSSNNTLSGNNASNSVDGIDLASSSNNTLSLNNASNNGDGISLYSSSNNNTLSGNNANSNRYGGISLDSSSNNTLSENTASNSDFGITLYSNNNNTLSGNTALNNVWIGISLYSSNNNTLSGNIASYNFDGIELVFSNNNFISGNIASYNNRSGIFMEGSSNIIYNNFFNNTNNLFLISYPINTWNITKTPGTNIIGGSYLGGNFWANPNGTGFSQTCVDSNSDGICDSPYILDANNTDYLPLTMAASGLLPVHNLNSGENFSTIQAAIDDADTLNGHTITVGSGTYHENLNVNKQLILKGINTGGGKPVVDAGGSGSAITLSGGNSTLEGFAAVNASYYTNAGIYVNSNNNILRNNTALNNNFGLYLYSSRNNVLNGNNASNNYDRGIYLNSSSRTTMIGNNASNNGEGIHLYSSSNNMLSGNNASKNKGGNGIDLLDSSNNNTLNGNTANSNYWFGIALYSSSSNALNGNTANSNKNNGGIGLTYSSNNTVSGNTVSNNIYGISLSSSSNSTLSGNNASNSYVYGIYLSLSSNNNNIYDNYFNNINNFYLYASYLNFWNITKTPGTNIIEGPYLGGNYWAYPNGTGFSQTCADSNGDGICDSPYTLDSNNIDYLPLAYKFTSTPTASVSIASQTVTSGSNVTVPIMANNITNLAAYTISLTYNPAVVVVNGVGAGALGGVFATINNATGVTLMSALSTTPQSGNVTVANVVLRAIGTAGQTSPLNLTVTTLSDNNGVTIQATVNNGTFTISSIKKGDVTGDGNVDITDALFIAQYTVGLRTLSPTQLAAGDVNCDGKVDITDALFIAQYTVGLRTTFC
jgi:parallel beta-helix repeat protein